MLLIPYFAREPHGHRLLTSGVGHTILIQSKQTAQAPRPRGGRAALRCARGLHHHQGRARPDRHPQAAGAVGAVKTTGLIGSAVGWGGREFVCAFGGLDLGRVAVDWTKCVRWGPWLSDERFGCGSRIVHPTRLIEESTPTTSADSPLNRLGVDWVDCCLARFDFFFALLLFPLNQAEHLGNPTTALASTDRSFNT
jgi:hypothetical protein